MPDKSQYTDLVCSRYYGIEST